MTNGKYSDLGFAKLDLERIKRRGASEAVFCECKTDEQLVKIFSEFKKQMADVYTTSVSKSTLDECPMAYKGMQDILDNITPTADVVKILRPIYNFKAGDEE